MKKVLFLTSVYSDLTGGTKYNRKFIDIITEDSDNFKVDILQNKDFGYPNGMRWFNGIKVYSKLYKLIKNYDIVITDSSKSKQLYFSLNKCIRKNPNTKFIMFHHHYEYHTFTGIKKLLAGFIEKKVLNKMDTIIYASEYTYNLKDKYINKKVENILVKVPVPRSSITKSKYDENNFSTIGGAGYGNRKGHDKLIESLHQAKNIDNFKLNIIGRVDENEKSFIEVNNLIKKYGLSSNIEYTGFVSDEQKYKILLNSKFYVFPSQYEGYGLSVLEAMSVGLPVVVFNNSAMPTIVKDGYNGFLCNSVKEFADKITMLFNDNSLAEQMGKNAISYVNTCQTEEQFYKDVKKFAKNLQN